MRYNASQSQLLCFQIDSLFYCKWIKLAIDFPHESSFLLIFACGLRLFLVFLILVRLIHQLNFLITRKQLVLLLRKCILPMGTGFDSLLNRRYIRCSFNWLMFIRRSLLLGFMFECFRLICFFGSKRYLIYFFLTFALL